MDICSLSLCELATELKERRISVTDAVKACYERIDQIEPKIRALLAQDRENAFSLAAQMDASGPDAHLPLWGVPVTIKDALSTKNLRTTAASRILENFVPFYDAYVVERMKKAGAIILAKNNMDEFAMGSSTENSAFQKTRNPWNLNHVPGGSSGGSAASVAAGECFASLGSDTGGSIRQPAAFCGCVGLKPSYGRVSRYGLFAFASSLDQIGPITKTVRDAAQVMQVISGHDPRDNTSADIKIPDYMAYLDNLSLEKPLAKLKIGFPRDCFSHGVSSEVQGACNKIMKEAQNMGAEIVDISLPDPDIASATYYIIAMAEASSNLARYDGVRYGRRANGVTTLEELYLKSRSEGFGQEVKRRIMLGSYVLSSGYYDAYFRKAAQTRRIIYNKYQEALGICDIIIMPVAPVTAWEIDAHALDPMQAYLMDAFTLPVNLAGLPSLSIPVEIGAHSGLPVGVQLIGKNFGEADLLRYGVIFEKELAFTAHPQFIQA